MRWAVSSSRERQWLVVRGSASALSRLLRESEPPPALETSIDTGEGWARGPFGGAGATGTWIAGTGAMASGVARASSGGGGGG